MAKGNPGGNKTSLPYPQLNEAEQVLILRLARYRESFSHEDIARILNEVFKDHNKGCRTRDGVKKFIAKKEKEVQSGPVQTKAA